MLSLLSLSPQPRANAAHHLALERPPQLLPISLCGRPWPLRLNLRCVVPQCRSCSWPSRRALEALQSCSPAQGMRCRAALEHFVVLIEGCQLCEDGLWPAAAGSRVVKSASRAQLVVASNFCDCEMRSLTFAIVGVGLRFSTCMYLPIYSCSCLRASQWDSRGNKVDAEDEHRRLSHTV